MTTRLAPAEPYPAVAGWDAYVASLAPSEALRERARAQLLGLFAAAEQTERSLQTTFAALVDPTQGYGGLLDLIGARLGEPRGGLADGEYLRILMGRQAVGLPGATYARAWSIWLALTGARDDQARMFRPPSSTPAVWFSALVDSPPTAGYLDRAGRLLREVTAGVEVYAVLGIAGSTVWGSTPWGAGTWGWVVPTGGM